MTRRRPGTKLERYRRENDHSVFRIPAVPSPDSRKGTTHMTTSPRSRTYEITWAYGMKQNINATRVVFTDEWIEFYGPMGGNLGTQAQLLLMGVISATVGIVSVRELVSIAPEGVHS